MYDRAVTGHKACSLQHNIYIIVYILAIFIVANTSRKHAYIILIPLNWGLQGYTLFFFFFAQNIDCGYSLEPPRRGGSNEYPQSMFWAGIWKISEIFFRKFSCFGGKIFSMYLNRCVFVMRNWVKKSITAWQTVQSHMISGSALDLHCLQRYLKVLIIFLNCSEKNRFTRLTNNNPKF